ncbi:MAG: DUF2937 family protein, partial [Pseudomonadota bacterium]
GPNRLYLNQGNWQFLDISEAAGVTGTKSWSTGVSFADVNADGLLEALCASYASIVTRFEFLAGHLDALTSATDLERPIVLARTYQRDIADSALSAYKPAVPTTIDGAVYGGGSFVGVWALGSLLFGGLGSLFGGRRRQRDAYGY